MELMHRWDLPQGLLDFCSEPFILCNAGKGFLSIPQFPQVGRQEPRQISADCYFCHEDAFVTRLGKNTGGGGILLGHG